MNFSQDGKKRGHQTVDGRRQDRPLDGEKAKEGHRLEANTGAKVDEVPAQGGHVQAGQVGNLVENFTAAGCRQQKVARSPKRPFSTRAIKLF